MIKLITIFALFMSFTQIPTVSAPSLTELQKAKLEASVLRMEVASYKYSQAERDMNVAIEELQRMLSELSRPGYDLDVKMGQYRPIPRKE